MVEIIYILCIIRVLNKSPSARRVLVEIIHSPTHRGDIGAVTLREEGVG